MQSFKEEVLECPAYNPELGRRRVVSVVYYGRKSAPEAKGMGQRGIEQFGQV